MSFRSWAAVAVLMSLTCTACNQNSRAPVNNEGAKDQALSTAQSPAETAEEKALKETIRAFQDGMASADKNQQKQALEKILFTKSDIEVLFPGREQFWGVFEFGLSRQPDDVDEYAKDAVARGEIVSIKLTNLRASDPNSSVVTMTAKEVPAYEAVVECKHNKVQFGPWFFIKGRWLFYPGLDKLTAVMPAADPAEPPSEPK